MIHKLSVNLVVVISPLNFNWPTDNTKWIEEKASSQINAAGIQIFHLSSHTHTADTECEFISIKSWHLSFYAAYLYIFSMQNIPECEGPFRASTLFHT